jgi:hypothetical protein
VYQARTLRHRGVTNENDENAGTVRLTRAKTAALTTTDASDVPKKALQTKRSTATLGANGAAQTKKRAALEDVSNVTKTELGVNGKEGKKPIATISKAAHPTKVQKSSRLKSTRPVLTEKSVLSTKRSALTEKNVSSTKRPASGAGIAGHVTKKRPITKTIKREEPEELENVEPQQAKENALVEEEVTKIERLQTDIEIFSDDIKEPATHLDLDKEDVDDPLMVSEYVVEIFEYLKELEITTMANPDYMENQNELEWKMRGILVDWLLEVHTRFRLLPETLFLAVNIIDRFLSAKIVQLDRLQLVGVTAMFIASKYEEVLSPHVQNFRHVADDGFTEEEILSAERFVLAALNYDLSYPNPMNFLRRISKADNYDIQTRTLGKYLLEISCLDHRFIGHPPSQVAAAAMYLARLVLERGEWVSQSFITLTADLLTFVGRHHCSLRWVHRRRDSACSSADDRLSIRPCCPRSILQEVCQQEVPEG